MGGKDWARWRRGASRGRTSTLSGISSSSSSSSSSPYRREDEDAGDRYAGVLVDAAVDGLRSCRGDGSRLMCAVCIVSAICVGSEDIVMNVDVDVDVWVAR